MEKEVIARLHSALPGIRLWIEETLNIHAEQARSVSSLGLENLAACFPIELLERTKVVTVPKVPFPPIHTLGLPELDSVQQLDFAGITFKDTFFLRQGRPSESLHFHEMIHVIQWERLGVDNFLLAYGVGLLHAGYEQSPLEKMAYKLQVAFDSGQTPLDLVSIVQDRTDAIWAEVLIVLQGIK